MTNKNGAIKLRFFMPAFYTFTSHSAALSGQLAIIIAAGFARQ
jgi:hypothetical protein